jgi:copper(I)-binding protein
MDKRHHAKWVLALLLATCALQAGAKECAPEMKEGWVRLPPAAMPMMAGFGRIHETRNVDGVNRMRELEQLRIAPDDSATLKPGGLHLMLMQPRAPLKEGSKVVVNFKLQDGREILSELVVKKPTP